MISISIEINTMLHLMLSYLMVRWMSMMTQHRRAPPLYHQGHHATLRTHTTDKHDLA